MRTAILSFLCLTLLVPSVWPQTKPVISDEAVKLSNQIILEMYQKILIAKDKHVELQNFGEDCLFKNDRGIFALQYQWSGEKPNDRYAIGVTINTMRDPDFSDRNGLFRYDFPKLNLKLTGFQEKHPLRSQFDMLPIISQYRMVLTEYQQQFMPLRIFIVPAKKVFKTRENIEFEVVLKNVSKRHMVVKTLGKDSLYFLINEQFWGTDPLNGDRGGKNKVLKSGEELRLRLSGESFLRPQEVEITGFYNMVIEGVNPMGKIKIRIED